MNMIIIRMQINIKVKFDKKKQKGSLWQGEKEPYFIENTQFMSKNKSPSEKFHFKSFRQSGESTHPDHPLTHRSKSKDIQTAKSKRANKTKSKGRKSKEPSRKKCIYLPKNTSDLIKMQKKKTSIFNSSNFLEEQMIRGSLPGLSGKKVLQRFAPLLSQSQKIQLINEKTVYYIGVGAEPGEDDLEGSYIWRKHEQLGYRYELLENIGSGVFGEVIRGYDHKVKEMVGIKIIRSKKEYMQLGLNEINILMKIKEKDLENEKSIVKIKDFIVFRKHICIVTELLSISLYDLMERNSFRSIDMQYIRTFSLQIFNALAFLQEQNIIHSDIKPENILLKDPNKTGIKLIDFGTSMFIHENNYMYIQSRFYRAPEVILGSSYDYAIDMWSAGCLLAELYLGFPLFSGNNEHQQISLIMQMIGTPAKQYLESCKNAHLYFRENREPKIIKSKQGKAIMPSSKPLNLQIQDKNFAAFLSKIFMYDGHKRLTPMQALIEPWIVEGLPQGIKEQHLHHMKLKMKKMEEKKISTKNTVKKHSKKNSDFVVNDKQVKHKRRRSDGLS